ncbi:flagellar hook-length control protein FliK [Methylobacterium nodulans]|uniref:Flagellar hook-length control protein n=1 Tax=Methylobacterium nodulans (strain LMG 21967 / CNCM I-2342 / ORS 2060) TaxID=460265 RepID=B8IU31_METNO|nr:flagellar hook-length control protein FliK [Methylobacterium nodulans]ACL60889.1 flagellar hook-length control protein [Methylobacterium nodulans ORS 2060]
MTATGAGDGVHAAGRESPRCHAGRRPASADAAPFRVAQPARDPARAPSAAERRPAGPARRDACAAQSAPQSAAPRRSPAAAHATAPGDTPCAPARDDAGASPRAADPAAEARASGTKEPDGRETPEQETPEQDKTLEDASDGQAGAAAPPVQPPPPAPAGTPIARASASGEPEAELAASGAAGAAAARAGEIAAGSPASDNRTEGAEAAAPAPGFAAVLADVAPPDAGAPPAMTAAAPSAEAQAPSPPPPPVPLGAVPMTIGLRSLAGSNRFEIRLDPADLGRIDVSLDLDREHGSVKAHLAVERPETLALLQRDAGSLQQALTQAGFSGTEAALSFSLQDGSGGQGRAGREGAPSPGRIADSAPADPDPVPLALLRGGGLGLDIRI